MAVASDSVRPDGSSSPTTVAASPSSMEATAPRPRVTVLSGFLGSGKTTLLRHLLTAAPPHQRVAVVVNDMAEINIDAALIRRITPAAPVDAANGSAGTSQGAANGSVDGPPGGSKGSAGVPPGAMVELQNGCICCTLRDDLIIHLTALARTTPPFDAIIVESTGVAEPLPVAESFLFEVDPQPPTSDTVAAATPSPSGDDAPQMSLNDIAPLDTLVTVVDVSVFGEMLSTTDAPVDRWGPSGGVADGSGDGDVEAGTPLAEPEEFRPLSQLLIEQVEYANVIILNKTDLVSAATTAVVRAQVRALNRGAVIVEASHGRVPFGQVVSTHAFNDAAVQGGAGWLVEMRAGGNDGAAGTSGTPGRAVLSTKKGTTTDASAVAARSELEEYNLSSFVYRRRRPFHPIRLAAALDTLCSMGEAVLRAKGFVWLATRHEQYGELSKAGATWVLGLGGTWLVMDPQFKVLAAERFGAPVPFHVAATAGPDVGRSTEDESSDDSSDSSEKGDEDSDEPNSPEDDEFAKSAMNDFDSALGDRRQEVVVIGRGMPRSKVERTLDAALLTDKEFALGSRQWALFPDELDSWSDSDGEGEGEGDSDGDDDGDSGSEGADDSEKAATVARAGKDAKACPDDSCTVPHANGKRTLVGAVETSLDKVKASVPKKNKQQ